MQIARPMLMNTVNDFLRLFYL